MPCGKEIYGDSCQDQRSSEPERQPVRGIGRVVLEKLELLEKESEARHHESESHEGEASANPGQKGALGSQGIAESSHLPGILGRVHVHLHHGAVSNSTLSACFVTTVEAGMTVQQSRYVISVSTMLSRTLLGSRFEYRQTHSHPLHRLPVGPAQTAWGLGSVRDGGPRRQLVGDACRRGGRRLRLPEPVALSTLCGHGRGGIGARQRCHLRDRI